MILCGYSSSGGEVLGGRSGQAEPHQCHHRCQRQRLREPSQRLGQHDQREQQATESNSRRPIAARTLSARSRARPRRHGTPPAATTEGAALSAKTKATGRTRAVSSAMRLRRSSTPYARDSAAIRCADRLELLIVTIWALKREQLPAPYRIRIGGRARWCAGMPSPATARGCSRSLTPCRRP
jgi:hypothetical protein